MTSADSHVVVVSSHRLHYDAATQTFSVDASDLQGPPCLWSQSRIDIRSIKTGDMRRFAILRLERDREGEIVSKVFTGPGQLKLVIYND